MSGKTFLEGGGWKVSLIFLGYVYLRTVLFLQETLRSGLHEIFMNFFKNSIFRQLLKFLLFFFLFWLVRHSFIGMYKEI